MTKRISVAIAAFGAALLAAGVAHAKGPEVEIKDAVARVVVIPEDRTDIKVEIVPGSSASLPTLEVSRTGSGKVIIDGGLKRKIRGCSGKASAGGQPLDGLGGVKIRLRGADDVSMAEAPLVTIRTPRNVNVEAGGAVYGWIGRADTVELDNAGCGDWTIGDVKGSLAASIAGSGDVRAGSSGSLSASIAGAGDFVAGPTGPLEVSIAGAGDIEVASVNGPVEASIAGAGDVRVRGGRPTDVDASIAGAGSVIIDAAVANVEASIVGAGDVEVRSVSGRVEKSIIGAGTVRVGG